MSPSLLRPSQLASMVIEGEEVHASRTWSSSSTLKAGLEGRLIDLWWQAMTLAGALSSLLCYPPNELSHCHVPAPGGKNQQVDANHKGGAGVQYIYKLRVLRRETLLWINFLNKVSTPLSRSIMTNSISSNCSSQTTLLFWNALETRDHFLELEMAICFERRLLVDLLELLLCLLGQADVRLHLGLKSRVLPSFAYHLHLLDDGLELGKALLHVVTDIEQDKRALELLLYRFPQLRDGRLCEHIVCSMLAYTSPSLLIPLIVVSMVDEEIVALRLCSCSSIVKVGRQTHGSENGGHNWDWTLEGVEERNSALDQFPEQSFNSALKINDDQLYLLQLVLLTNNSSLLECLGDKRPFVGT
ncbi:hypothetical protein U9M48_037869 [Paspalum notatum var. saurae]|uniref:Uncharacterized protein n=1 Tax=Paspalum notatum var. saurae TaxID=547442 RepID=A0AAQ3XAJ4_PASNO